MATKARVKRILEPAETTGSVEKAAPSEPLLQAANDIGAHADINAILLDADATRIQDFPDGIFTDTPVILVSNGPDNIPEHLASRAAHILTVPPIPFTRMSLIKTAIMIGLSSEMLDPADTVLCLTGIADFGQLDTMLILDIEKEFEMLSSAEVHAISESVQPAIFQAALNLAIELAHQGRESRHLGTIFVLGDVENVMQLSRQLIINPFKGYAEDERNVLDPALRETIKEFATMDGAFVIREDGVLVTAGRYLNVAVGDEHELPKGLGARHAAAAGITSMTNAIAIVLSESTGDVRIFRHGTVVMEIEKATR